MINRIRLTSFNSNGGSGSSLLTQASGIQASGLSGGHLGIDEMVFSPQGGVLATLQEPPNYISLLNDSRNPVSHSYIL